MVEELADEIQAFVIRDVGGGLLVARLAIKILDIFRDKLQKTKIGG